MQPACLCVGGRLGSSAVVSGFAFWSSQEKKKRFWGGGSGHQCHQIRRELSQLIVDSKGSSTIYPLKGGGGGREGGSGHQCHQIRRELSQLIVDSKGSSTIYPLSFSLH